MISYKQVIPNLGSMERKKEEYNDCVVVAIAVSHEMSYDEAHELAAKKLRRKSKRGVPRENTRRYLRKNYEKVVSHWEYHNKKRNTTKKFNMSVKKFAETYTRGSYMVFVRRHALSVVNGVIIDHPELLSKPRRVVMEAYRIK